MSQIADYLRSRQGKCKSKIITMSGMGTMKLNRLIIRPFLEEKGINFSVMGLRIMCTLNRSRKAISTLYMDEESLSNMVESLKNTSTVPYEPSLYGAISALTS